MIASNSAGNPMFGDNIKKQRQDCRGAVVGVDADAGNVAREAIDEAVDDKFPPDET